MITVPSNPGPYRIHKKVRRDGQKDNEKREREPKEGAQLSFNSQIRVDGGW